MIYPFVPNQQFPQAAQKLRFVWWWWWWRSFAGPSASAQSDTSGGVCSEALASFPAFRVRLRELSFFKHQSRSWTVWLKPETEVVPLLHLASSLTWAERGAGCVCVTHQPEGALVRLQGELERVFPHCNDQSQIGEHGFTPHLSVANDFRKAVRHPSPSFVLFFFSFAFALSSPASLILSTLYL
jgi:2'-5' RNA ligase